MLKKYNSITAKRLAKKYKLKLRNIKSHRKDNKITIKDVKNNIKKLKNKKLKNKKLKNKFGKLDYIYEHELIIDGIQLTPELVKFLNDKIKKYKDVIKEFKIVKKDKLLLKYKISEDDNDKIDEIQEYITLLFNKQYTFNNDNFIILITQGKFKEHNLDESDMEIINGTSETSESKQGKPDIKTKKYSGWTEYDFS